MITMHEILVKEVVATCKKRLLDNDDYDTRPCSREILEEAVIELDTQLDDAKDHEEYALIRVVAITFFAGLVGGYIFSYVF